MSEIRPEKQISAEKISAKTPAEAKPPETQTEKIQSEEIPVDKTQSEKIQAGETQDEKALEKETLGKKIQAEETQDKDTPAETAPDKEISEETSEQGRKVEAEPWEELGLANDFLFGKVMQDPVLCQTLLEYIFPELEIIKIDYPVLQKSIKNAKDAHGVRLDVYVKDSEERIFNIEMQPIKKRYLPKRSRYYQSMIDLQNLDQGESYRTLNTSYIIFICLEDMFGKKRHKYTFDYICREDNDIRLNDGATKIFLNAAGELDDINENLKAFLDYLRGIPSDHPYVTALEQAVRKAKMNKEWRREYMIMALRDQDKLWEGIEQGMEQGKTDGNREALLNILKEKWNLPEELKIQIEKQDDYGLLSRWIVLAATEATLESFREKIGEDLN